MSPTATKARLHFWTSPVFWTSLAALAGVLLFNSCSMSMKSPSGQSMAFAFVTNTGSGTVSTFSVASNGVLSPVAGSSMQSGAGAEFMAFDAVHKLLFVSNQQASTLSVFAVNTSRGSLTAMSGSPIATGTRPIGVVVDNGGRFVFVADQGSNGISVFSIGASGTLSPVPGSPFPAINPYGLALNASGTVLYATNFPDSQMSDLNTVSAFSVSATGALAPVAGSPFPDANTAAGFASGIGIMSDPSGKFLFVGDHMAESVVPFTVNASGGITPVSALPTPAASCNTSCHNNPLRLAVDPADRFLYATDVAAGTVSSFSINGGNLSPAGTAPAGQHPFGLAFAPGGGFLYVVNKVDNSISSYAVNASTGQLSPMNTTTGNGLNAPTDIVTVGATM
jgi:6-phosphogluconolactonase (cycloisomerase 2 family)